MSESIIKELCEETYQRIRTVAVKAALEIESAVTSINADAGKTMVLWPIELKVLHDGAEFVFEFTELVSARPPKLTT